MTGAGGAVPPGAAEPTAVRDRDRAGLICRALRGRESDPAWVRPALMALLGVTGLLYLSDLSASGWANGYYSAAVQAASKSWKAAFFGSFDASNFISVDKPPGSLWVMDLSARLFGVNSWSILVPEALEGMASVLVLYVAVRRWSGPAAGLLAGVVLAVTPVATLMFRFDNPDALLTLLTVLAVYAFLRAVESGRTSWLVGAGALVGAGFATKMLQALVVIPVLGAVYLWSGRASLRRRLSQLVAAGAVMVATGGWWVAAVQLQPAAARPYIGSSRNNSLLELIFGYNGFGRLTGKETGAVGFTSSSAGGGGPAGWLRMLDAQFRTQIGWLLPAAVVLGAFALWASRRAGRGDPARAALLTWSGVLVVTAGALSLGQGVIHTYYSVALAPPIAAVVAIGAVSVWERRSDRRVRRLTGLTVAATLAWALWISSATAPWRSAGLAVLTVVLASLGALLGRMTRRSRAVAPAAVVVLCLAGPLAFSVETAAAPHDNAVAVAGFAQGRPRNPVGTIGSLLYISRPPSALTAVLRSGGERYRWIAATVGGEQAAGYQLATGQPVMDIGGFNGTDPTPTLGRFKAYVAAGDVHWFVVAGPPVWLPQPAAGAAGDVAGPPPDAATVTTWVEHHFPVEHFGAISIYDLADSARIPPSA